MLKKANIPWSAKQLTKSIDKGTVKFDNAVQRGYVWDQSRKSLLIHSMIEGYPIPPFYATKEDNIYSMLDGKQRSEAISKYINNQYELIGLPEVALESDETMDVNGLTFEKLPIELQDEIKDYSLTIYYFDGITDEEVNEMFFRLNNGKPLTSIELTRVKAKSIEIIKEIGRHSIFNSALTEKAMNKYTNEDIVIKSWVILNSENPSFETKQIRPILESAEITPEQAEVITTVYDKVLETYTAITGTGEKQDAKVAKRLITRTHLVSIMPIVAKLIANDTWNTEKFTAWTRKFFAGTKSATISEIYNEAARSSSGKVESVKKRLNAVNDDYNAFAWVITPKTKAQTETEQQEVKPVTHNDVLSIINEVMNETPNTDDSANISENTNPENETKELGNELVNDTVLGEDNAETLLDTSDASENEEIAGDSTQDDGIEVEELTIDDIPETDGLEEQAS